MTCFKPLLDLFARNGTGMSEQSVLMAMEAIGKIPDSFGGNNASAFAHAATEEYVKEICPQTSRDIAKVVSFWISKFMEVAEEKNIGGKLDAFILVNGS